MVDKICVDTEYLEYMSNRLRQMQRSLSIVQTKLNKSVSEIRWAAPQQYRIIQMVIDAEKDSKVVADKMSRLSSNVQCVSSIWSDAESRITNQNFVVAKIPQKVVETTDTQDTQRSEREEQAKWFKIALTGVCIIGSIAVVVATGGAALPVIATGVITGAVSAAGTTAADQYAERGWEEIDWADVGKDAVIGGVVGGVTSGIGVGGGAVANQAMSTVAQGATTATGRMIAHVAGGTVTSVVTGTVSRAAGEAVSESLNEGDVDWDKVRERAFDPGSMIVDGAIGGATGFIQGKNYNSQYDRVRKESYLQQNPYEKNYGDIDWKGHVGDGIDYTKPDLIDDIYEIPTDTYLRRTGPESGYYLRGLDDSFDSASLPYKYDPSQEHVYRVIKPIPETAKSVARPGFDMPGGATQYNTKLSVKELIEQGYIIKIY